MKSNFGHCDTGYSKEPRNCILIGIDAGFEHVKRNGDILFATPENKVLFSEGVMYLNGEQVGFANADVLDAIRDAMLSIRRLS
jgi:hypothetical protein